MSSEGLLLILIGIDAIAMVCLHPQHRKLDQMLFRCYTTSASDQLPHNQSRAGAQPKQ